MHSDVPSVLESHRNASCRRFALLWAACWLVACAGARPHTAPKEATKEATTTPQELSAQADLAYDKKDYAGCARLLKEAAARSPGGAAAHSLFNAAGCYALGGDPQQAFAALDAALEHGFVSLRRAESEGDLASLHQDGRWAAFVAATRRRQEQYVKTLNAELYGLYEEDQKSRAGGPDHIDWKVVAVQDQQRRRRVLEILAAGSAKASDDYYHASLIFQHGEAVADFEQAHTLALRAVELDPRNDKARWLAAATQDRALMIQDKPQLYGTQFKKVDGTWILYPVQPEVTDAERARWNVPPLWSAKRQAENLNHPQ